MEPEYVSPSDRALIRAAIAELERAQHVHLFTQAHISRTYGLQPGDQIDDSGQIIRRAPPPPATAGEAT